MNHIEIYFKSWCPYSQRALRLLNARGVEYTAIDLTNQENEQVRVHEREMRKRAGRTSGRRLPGCHHQFPLRSQCAVVYRASHEQNKSC
jgi:glutaredoxin